MIYLINERIHFRPEDGAIWEGSKKESEVTITITMSRLLTLLLQRKGDVVTRDEILDKVWDAHGLRSSNNSLNKYIAELRKVFTSFEVHDEVITTVPRVGFMLSGNIIVDILEEKIDNDITEIDIPSVKTVSLSRDLKIDKASPKILIWALSVLSLIIISAFPFNFHNNFSITHYLTHLH
ncbi:winged helix-turn-helix domain-containing protein [Enterobacter sp. CP102]|uniref:winged helix-turn-helix domain-containing protein n=1 Tax=Enterobacter sp. CP102 TaxID=2976431 RepID=UPI0021FF356F|nr:winged helix-turn-helix domain-containing protein [Enterobacter sp. CP102]UWM63220.1 winged helix-turn-helix domain-containing protein [Enterobacter sp. CP102]